MPALPQLYPYKAGEIDKIALPGEIVGIYVSKVYYFYTVIYIEGIPISDPIEIDLGALAAGASTAITQLALLEMQDKEFGQFRAEVLDDIAADLYQGRGVRRLTLKNRTARYTRFSPLRDPDGHLGEFYVHEDDFAFMQATNLTDYALEQSRVRFWGFRYGLEECLDEQGGKLYDWSKNRLPQTWTRVPATGRE